MADVLDVINKQRRGLDLVERDTVWLLTERWRMIAEDLEQRYTGLLDEIEMLRADGKPVTIGRIFRTERARALFIQAERQLDEYAKLIGTSTDQAIQQAAKRALADADELTRYVLGPLPDDAIGSGLFVQLPTDAVNDLTAIVQNGPVRDILLGYGSKATGQLREALLTGLAYGENPLVVARRMAEAMGGALQRARTIARTEMLRAYRESGRRWYQANSKTVKGWVWHSATDGSTCAACWAMHGEEFELDEPMGTHPNCRCSMVPKTRTWKELGFNVPKHLESTYDEVPGVKLFANLTDKDQRTILGRKGKALFDAGEFDLGDLVREKHSQAWGVTRSRDSLKNAVARKAARGGAPRPPRPAAKGRPAPIPKDTPELEERFRKTRAQAQREARKAAQPPKPKPAPKASATSTPAPKAPPKPKPRTKYGQEIDKIKGNRTRADWNEADVRQAGAVTRKEIDKRANVGKLTKEHDSIIRERRRIETRRAELLDEYNDELTKLNRGAGNTARLDRIQAIEQERDALLGELVAGGQRQKAIAKEIIEGRVKVSREVLAEARPYGTSSRQLGLKRSAPNQRTSYGRGNPTKVLDQGTNVDAEEMFQGISGDYPDQWWDELADATDANPYTVGFTGRGYHSKGAREIWISGDNLPDDVRELATLSDVARHEIGHAMEHNLDNLIRLEKEFYERRTQGEKLVRLVDLFPGSSYGRDEKTRVDQFIEPYMGKPNPSGAFELLTMGVQVLFGDPSINKYAAKAWADDTDFLDFILGLLSAV